MQRRSASINVRLVFGWLRMRLMGDLQERSPQLSFSGYTSTLGDVLNEDPLTAMNRRASASIYFDNPAAVSEAAALFRVTVPNTNLVFISLGGPQRPHTDRATHNEARHPS